TKILSRLPALGGAVDAAVKTILEAVRDEGDRAVIRYTKKFDQVALTPHTLRVSKSEIRSAYQKVDSDVIKSLEFAARRIFNFHERQKSTGWVIEEAGITLAQRVFPIARVGLYVPGGKAAYPSSVLMNAIPAIVAGCRQIQICTPIPDGLLNPTILVAADLVGITEIYKVGGAQAIGAMAYGTKTIPKVDKIVGPGNQYVASAKRLVFGLVDIDMIAGPSELVIIADKDATPAYVASDLLSQAEHDEEAVVILLTPSLSLVKMVVPELARQQANLLRKKIVAESLRRHGTILITRDIAQAIKMANEIAPEHLSLFVKNPHKLLDQIIHAGSVFLGEDTPQALGDYIAGPNHVLPTGGTARFFSPLSVDDFIKKNSVTSYSKAALIKDGHHLVRIAEMEGLTAHANMVRIRMSRGGVASPPLRQMKGHSHA
ncbi:MAG: histidinol dehydrogenase, partial [Nitrospirae bacterium]|nr:histidinol dehydrogenase [Candidatus Troglogloeales bacterium]